jgi:hypothetical protein
MKKLPLITSSLLALAATAASGEEKVRASLIGYQEVPSVSTVARGRFEAEINRGGESFDYTLEYSGLQGQVTQAHIHFAQRGVNGPIIIWLCGTANDITGIPNTPGPAGTPTCPQSGVVTGHVTAANVLPAAPTQQLGAGEIEEAIAAMRARAAYVNVHTTISGGGEIRGQLGARGRSDGHAHHH